MDRALIYAAPRCCRIEDIEPITKTSKNEIIVRTLFTGVSRGTERLVFEGRVPEAEWLHMSAPNQVGTFPFPVRYGYCAVGKVEDGPSSILNNNVFGLFPHQSRFAASAESLVVLPDALPPRRATLGANMETALNAVWDSGAGPGDRIAIIGGGILGGLLSGLCGAIPRTDVTLIDSDISRKTLADHMNVLFVNPQNAPTDCDIVFHTSSSESGAITALGCAGIESTVIELSWFGDTRPALPLGGAFHRKRLRYISSQVGMVSHTRRARWSYHRRLSKALEILCDPRYDALITEDVAFNDLPERLPDLLAANAPGLATAVHY